MKNFYLNILILLALLSCNQETSTDQEILPEKTDSIQLLNKTYNFGAIRKTDTLTCSFEFINRSEKALVIKNVKPSCGCTTAEFSKDPIKKDGKGKVDVVFVPKATGFSRKSVVLETNFNPPFRVFYLEGNVEG